MSGGSCRTSKRCLCTFVNSELRTQIERRKGRKMRSLMKLSATLVAGAVVGALAMHGLHAQGKPPVYVVNEIDVTDKAGFQTYAAAQQKMIEKHGGKYIIRGGKVVAT